jgi:hypothetical protein
MNKKLVLVFVLKRLVYCSWIQVIHYQKIDKYKRKYRGNISVGKFPRDFTDGNIPTVYTEGITVGKKIKTNQKKNDDVSFLPVSYYYSSSSCSSTSSSTSSSSSSSLYVKSIIKVCLLLLLHFM